MRSGSSLERAEPGPTAARPVRRTAPLTRLERVAYCFMAKWCKSGVRCFSRQLSERLLVDTFNPKYPLAWMVSNE